MAQSFASPISWMTKISKRVLVRVQGQNFKILNSFRKFGTGENINLKFGTRTDLGKSHLKHEKTPKGAWSGSSDQKLKFKPPSVNLERVKL